MVASGSSRAIGPRGAARPRCVCRADASAHHGARIFATLLHASAHDGPRPPSPLAPLAPRPLQVRVHAAVLLVRSPVDAIDSYWHMVLTTSHTCSVRATEYTRLRDEWREHVHREAAVWAAFHRYWLGTRTPLLAIRYEDLLDVQVRSSVLAMASIVIIIIIIIIYLRIPPDCQPHRPS